MHTRRDFLKRAAQMSAAAGMWGAWPAAIRQALAIEPAAGSTYLDAEHVVILMQENRSFDHAFGTLQGVRGFNDPRAITLPDGNPVWVQANAAGERYVPFRLDLKNTKATWMGSLPHSWADQVDARDHGRCDRWLVAKRSGQREYAGMPLTLGYCTRADIPFYYALADAFTICDQHFCSCLTGTTPNRLHLWTGTIRERQAADAPANVRNEEVDFGRWASWTTFPERLEDRGISWKIYQNDLSIESGLSQQEDAWLANFTDNPIEWFTQFNVRLAATHRRYRDRRVTELPGEIAALKKQLAAHTGPAGERANLEMRIADLSATLKRFEEERVVWTEEKFHALSPREKSLHARAFCTNVGDPVYRQLAEIAYRDGDVQRTLRAPRRDAFLEEIHRAQFKERPTGYRMLTRDDIEQIRRDQRASPLLPRKEPGVRRSCPLPYELVVDGSLSNDRDRFTIVFETKKDVFGERSAGSPFVVYAYTANGAVAVRNYAVETGERREDSWALNDFDGGRYHLCAYGPNGYFREFIGGRDDPPVDIRLDYVRTQTDDRMLTGAGVIGAANRDSQQGFRVEVRDHAYKNPDQARALVAGGRVTLVVETQRSSGW